MTILKGHSIFAHSRSSTSEEFSLFIIKYILLSIGKIKPLKYYVLSTLWGNL
jgi:hypothetical protein